MAIQSSYHTLKKGALLSLLSLLYLIAAGTIFMDTLTWTRILPSLSVPPQPQPKISFPPEDIANFFNNNSISFTHIPKCAGTSFVKQAKPMWHEQNCYQAMYKPHAMNVVFLRSPTSHVVSQFFYCKYSEWAKDHRKSFPDTGNGDANDSNDFLTWLDHFLALNDSNFGKKFDFNCIDPRNVQTRHMGCREEPNPRANHHLEYPQDLKTAVLYTQHHATFVGISDFYHESLCLLNFRRERTLRSTCKCGANQSTIGDIHHTHDTKAHDSVVAKPIQEKIDLLTGLDRILFVKGLERFLVDMDLAEYIAGEQILCDRGKVEEMLNDYSVH